MSCEFNKAQKFEQIIYIQLKTFNFSYMIYFKKINYGFS